MPMHCCALVLLVPAMTPTRRDAMLESIVRSRPPQPLAPWVEWQNSVAQFIVTMVAPSFAPVQSNAVVPPAPVAPPVAPPPVPLLPPVPLPVPASLATSGSRVPGHPDNVGTRISAPMAPANPNQPRMRWRARCIGFPFYGRLERKTCMALVPGHGPRVEKSRQLVGREHFFLQA